MEENPNRGTNEQMLYGAHDIPYYEYSSAARPAQPPAFPQPLPQTPPLPSQQVIPPPQLPRRKRTLPLILMIVGVVLVVALVLLAGLSQVLFRPSVATKTPVSAAPTQAPTQSSGQPITPTASFRASACPFQLGTGIVDGKTVSCGYVTVPENRQNPNGAKVQLAVALFKRQKCGTISSLSCASKVDPVGHHWIIGRVTSLRQISQTLCSTMT